MTREDSARWHDSLLTTLDASGLEGRLAADYLRAHQTTVWFLKLRPHVGAFWTPWRSVGLNQTHFTRTTPLTDPSLLTLVIHEVCHLQQGMLNALSVRGELEAWQLQFREYQRLTRPLTDPVLLELLSLPLNWDRAVLKRARELMQAYAGKAYRADLLPLYPFPHEFRYWMTRRPPSGV
ncbi:MAG: hypothetical protein HYZ25_18275 [Chloroflexi bacterium]|nr:hypothetical protein [Chloroflexota bacterium]